MEFLAELDSEISRCNFSEPSQLIFRKIRQHGDPKRRREQDPLRSSPSLPSSRQSNGTEHHQFKIKIKIRKAITFFRHPSSSSGSHTLSNFTRLSKGRSFSSQAAPVSSAENLLAPPRSLKPRKEKILPSWDGKKLNKVICILRRMSFWEYTKKGTTAKG